MLTAELQSAPPEFSPYTLEGIAERTPALVPYFSRLGYTVDDYSRRHGQLMDAGNYTDELEGKLVARLSDDNALEDLSPRHYAELVDIYGILSDAIHETHTSTDEGTDWGTVAISLVEKAGPAHSADTMETFEARRKHLVSGFTASLFADDRQFRRDFIRYVYDAGLRHDMSSSLQAYNFSYAFQDQTPAFVQRYTTYAQSFEAGSQALDQYLAYTDPGCENDDQKLRAKRVQRAVVDAYRHGAVDTAQLKTAQEASRAAADKQGGLIDPYKVERFALEQMFIQDQLQALFPDSNLAESPLVRQLKAYSSYASQHGPVHALTRDTQQVIELLTMPVINAYRFEDRYISNPPTLQQLAGRRFMAIGRETYDMRQVARYIEYDKSILGGRGDETRIYDVSSRGAAAPDQAEILIRDVLRQALLYTERTGDMPTADKLRDICLRGRKHLIKLSMMNIQDFSELSRQGHFRPQAIKNFRTIQNATPITRQEDGTLAMRPTLVPHLQKDIAKTHEGATLGCPAGRVGHEELHHSPERGTEATNSLVDYIVEAMIREAHRRGIFELKNYQPKSEAAS